MVSIQYAEAVFIESEHSFWVAHSFTLAFNSFILAFNFNYTSCLFIENDLKWRVPFHIHLGLEVPQIGIIAELFIFLSTNSIFSAEIKLR